LTGAVYAVQYQPLLEAVGYEWHYAETTMMMVVVVAAVIT